jgi:hypothetical protein
VTDPPVKSLSFQQKTVEDPLFADFIQFVPPVEPPQVARAAEESKAEAPQAEEKDEEIDLDEIRRNIQEIADDVQLHEPTLSPRNAAILQSARELRKPLAMKFPVSLQTDDLDGDAKREKRKPSGPAPESSPSESREIVRIISSLWKDAMDGVLEEMTEAFNTVHLDILTKLAQIQDEIEYLHPTCA